MGRAIPGHEIAILDDRGDPVTPGGLGEIACRAPDPVMFVEYWNRPDATAEKFATDAAGTRWPLTGDTGRMDEAGWITFVGRADDRSEEHTSELQSLMRISYAVFCLKKKK